MFFITEFEGSNAISYHALTTGKHEKVDSLHVPVIKFIGYRSSLSFFFQLYLKITIFVNMRNLGGDTFLKIWYFVNNYSITVRI